MSTSEVKAEVDALNSRWVDPDKLGVLNHNSIMELFAGDWLAAMDSLSEMPAHMDAELDRIYNVMMQFAAKLNKSGGSNVLNAWNDPEIPELAPGQAPMDSAKAETTTLAYKLMFHAHSLKGAARSLHITRVAAAASNLEQMAICLRSIKRVANENPSQAVPAENVARQLTSKFQGMLNQLKQLRTEFVNYLASLQPPATGDPTSAASADPAEEDGVEYEYVEEEVEEGEGN